MATEEGVKLFGDYEQGRPGKNDQWEMGFFFECRSTGRMRSGPQI